MKRRDMILSTVGLAGSMLPYIGKSAEPCPPPLVAADGGAAVSTICPTVAARSYSTNFPASRIPSRKVVCGRTEARLESTGRTSGRPPAWLSHPTLRQVTTIAWRIFPASRRITPLRPGCIGCRDTCRRAVTNASSCSAFKFLREARAATSPCCVRFGAANSSVERAAVIVHSAQHNRSRNDQCHGGRCHSSDDHRQRDLRVSEWRAGRERIRFHLVGWKSGNGVLRSPRHGCGAAELLLEQFLCDELVTSGSTRCHPCRGRQSAISRVPANFRLPQDSLQIRAQLSAENSSVPDHLP